MGYNTKMPTPERFQKLGNVLEFAVEHLYNLQVPPETLKSISLLEECLKKDSAVVYFNHICLDDDFLVLALLLKKVRSISAIGGPGSKKHYDFREGLMNGLVMRLASSLGIEVIPLVQHYDREAYSKEERFLSYLHFIRTAKRILNQPGGGLFIAPEGTRSPDGVLQSGQEGIGAVSKLNKRIWFVPVGVIPQGQFSLKLNCHLNRSQAGKFEIKMGNPFQLEESIRKMPRAKITKTLMQELACLLPQKMRGNYT